MDGVTILPVRPRFLLADIDSDALLTVETHYHAIFDSGENYLLCIDVLTGENLTIPPECCRIIYEEEN